MKTKFVKRLMAMALIACMGCAVVGCSGDKGDDASSNNSGTKDERTTYEVLKELNLDEFITLGEYKGLKLEKQVTVVTDKEVQAEIEGQLAKYPVEVTDRTVVKDGDTINMDFVGRMDGEEFEGGSAKDVDLVIGSGSLIDGFESGLVGVSVGEEVVLELKFPDPYTNNPDLSGEPVEFTVVVNSIDKAPLEAPTDAWVKEYFKECNTVAEFETLMRTMLQEAYDEASDASLAYDAWEDTVEAATIHKYPEVLVERGRELYRSEIESYLSYYGGDMDLDDYLEYSGVTKDEYETFATEYGQSIAAQGMINYAICQAEGIEMDGEEFKAELKALAEEYDCTEEELYKKYAKDDIEQTVLLNIVCDLLVEEAEVTEVKSSESAE